MALPIVFHQDQTRLGAKVSRNVVFNSARLVLLAPLPFVMIPFFLKKLGPSGYGTWAVFFAISNMTSLADIGLVTTLSKHVAEFYALKDFRALSRLTTTGLVLYFGIASLIAGILWLSSPLLLPALFRGSGVPTGQLLTSWHCLVVLIVGNILIMLFSSVVIGLQRMDLSSTIGSMNLLSSAGLSVLFLTRNLGLRGILYSYALAAWITSLVYIYALHRLLPELKLDLAACSWAEAREILSFSAKTYVTQIAVVIHNQMEKIYLARFVGVVSVGWYDISSDLALKLRGIPSLVLAPIMPAASELHALNDQNRLTHLYFRTHKYLAAIGVPLVVYTVFVSRRFVELWVGPALQIIALPLSVLLVVNFINLMTGPGFLILVGAGKLKPGLYSALLGMVLNLSISLILIRAFGFRGAVIGTSISLIIASFFFLYLFYRETRGAFPKVLRRAYLKPIGSSLAVVIALWRIARLGRSSWGGLVGYGIVFGLAYVALLLLFRFFDTFDLALVENFLPLPRIIRRIIPDAELGSTVLSHSESAQTTAG